MNSDIEFIEIGGEYRPVAYNFNVVKNVQEELNTSEYRDKMKDALTRKLEEVDAESVEDLTEDQKEDLVASQGGTDYILYQFFYSLKEGHRKAGKEFIIDDVEINYNPQTGEQIESVNGTRDITPEDVGDWISSLDEEEADKFNTIIAERDISEDQKKV